MAEKKPKVMVVDDDEMVRDFMLRALPRFGFEPVGVASARRALAVLRGNAGIEVVLLDWMMPEMDGIDFLIELRRTDTTTPVIMTTAKTGKEDVIAAISAGVSDYISKPIHLGKLVMKINAALSRERPAVAPSVAQGRA